MDLDELVHGESFRDRISTVTEKGKRNWIYALQPKGSFYTYRTVLAYLYFAVFLIVPFIHYNGNPLVLFNVIEGKFILFGKIFWPQDFFIFAFAMITFIIFIVLFTVIYGRLFCGWACPQTIFMEFIFRKVEWLIEGTPNQQRQLNSSPWTTEKIWKKTLKHIVFFAISFLIAHTFLSYILGVKEVWKILREPLSNHLALFSGLVVFTFMFYAVFAFVREIVCTTICPYGRLQGVMFDKDTMQIAYDYKRGEERGRINKKEPVRTKGDCIDCHKCVVVCPTGIDIRNGLQMECVGCTACIDACDEVMDKVGFPRGLIRYASENEIRTGQKFKFNTRSKAYTVLLIGLLALMAGLIASRKPVDTYISRVKGQLFQEVENGTKLSNLYEAKIINKTTTDAPITLKVENMPGVVKLVSTQANLTVKKETLQTVTFFVEIPATAVTKHSTDLEIGVYRDGEKMQTVETTFLGPF